MRRVLRRLYGALAQGAGVARAAYKKLPSRRQVLRTAVGVAAMFLLLGAPSIMYRLYVQSVEMDFFQLHMADAVANVSANDCSIPDFDPFDPRTRHFVFAWAPVDCGRTQPYLTYVDANGRIRVNETGVREAGLELKDIECMYEEIRREAMTDDAVSYGLRRGIGEAAKVTAPFVRARCVRRKGGGLLYETGHAYVPPLSGQLATHVRASSPLRPSVLLVGVDSMSRLNFLRQLPRTHKLLTQVFGATVFSGMVKVGDNTYPNMLTMLTGMAARKKEGVKGRYWGANKARSYFDELPLVWHNFSDNGYVTMYAEDLPEFTAFNYLAKGFAREPVHYYMRPFWLAMDAIKNFRSSDDRCYGNVPQYEYLFNYTRDFAERMRDHRYFAFSFITGYSHNHLNSVQVLDEPLYELLAGLRHSGALRNTVLLVLGDHGNRFDAIRSTVVGRVEERMPFLAVALPAALRAARPHLEEGLRGNVAALLSWYDVYELLADVALGNLEAASRVERWGQLGSSLFRPVPARSCLEAGVPTEYCVCAHERALQRRDPAVWAAARALVAHVNAQLPADVCAPLALVEVLNAQLLLPNAQLARPQGFFVTMRVAVRVEPSQALLEGTLERDAWETDGHVVGEVARINKYGNQSHCLEDKILRLYCYCVDLLGRAPAPPPPSLPPAA